MDRSLVYPTEGIQDSHILYTNKHGMMGLGYALQAILGTQTYVDGLACLPTAPASLSVTVATGSIYSLQNVDATAYGTIAADTANQVVKQGISLGATSFTLTPPATSGKSQVYLIQATYQDQDAGASSQPFVSSDGTQTFQTVTTVRKGVCVLSLKAGVIGNTGSQVTPSPDAGYVALYTITVANGQATITSPNIVRVAGAPFLDNKLAALAPINSPAFTGSPTAPTPSLADLSTLIATTAFVKNLSLSSLTSPGYQKFPNGLIMQFGTAMTVASGNHRDITYPLAFPTGFLAGFSTALIDTDSTNGNISTGFSNALLNPLTQASIRNLSPSGSFNISYAALGY